MYQLKTHSPSSLVRCPLVAFLVNNFAEVASSGIKRLYFQWILEKLVVSIEIKFFSMVAGLQNNSATWPLRFRIKSLAMDKWYLVSLVAHLNWPGFLENFFAFSSLQQFQVKPSVTTREWVPWKVKPHVFTSCFITANDRAKFDYWSGRKTLLYFCLYGLMT